MGDYITVPEVAVNVIFKDERCREKNYPVEQTKPKNDRQQPPIVRQSPEERHSHSVDRHGSQMG